MYFQLNGHTFELKAKIERAKLYLLTDRQSKLQKKFFYFIDFHLSVLKIDLFF